MKITTLKEYQLDNGLYVALQETPTKTVTGRLKILHGALNENPGEEGLAHYLEHTFMTGGSQKYTPEQVDEIRSTFGSFNAGTGLDTTTFPVGMMPAHTSLYLEFVSDIIFNPRFDKVRLEEERQRVMREIGNKKGNPALQDQELFTKTFFGQDSPMNYSVLGQEEVILNATANNLNDFLKRGFNPNNMSLILVGKLPENIEELIEQNFGSYPSGPGEKFEFPRNPPLTDKHVIHSSAPELLNHGNPQESNSQLSISLFAPIATDKDFYAVDMLVDIFGTGTDSRLFTQVSQREGLAYNVGANFKSGNNQGLITMGGQVHSIRAQQAIDIFFKEMGRLRTELVPQEKLEKLKRHSLYQIAIASETNSGHVSSIQLKAEENLTFDDYMENVEKITPEQIREVAQKYFPKNINDSKYVLMLRDPLKE